MKILSLSFVLFIAIFFMGCTPEQDAHYVRVYNNLKYELLDVNKEIRLDSLKFGSVCNFGTLQADSYTRYIEVPEGGYDVSASLTTFVFDELGLITDTIYEGRKSFGRVNISGDGNHSWTVTIFASVFGETPIAILSED